jgi:hypothetical protein
MLFGENRVQEAAEKIPAVGPGPKWHMIGRLQTNKTTTAVRLFDCVESVDSVPLAEALDRAARETGKILPVFDEVNIGEEARKKRRFPEMSNSLESAAVSSRFADGSDGDPARQRTRRARPYFLHARLWTRLRGGASARRPLDGDVRRFRSRRRGEATIVRLGTVSSAREGRRRIASRTQLTAEGAEDAEDETLAGLWLKSFSTLRKPPRAPRSGGFFQNDPGHG